MVFGARTPFDGTDRESGHSAPGGLPAVTDANADNAPPDRERANDGARFRALFDAHVGYVAHTLRRLGVREADLADVTQDVFVVVHRKLGDYDPTRPIRPWLFGIAFRVASDYAKLARHRREVVVDAAEEHAVADHDPERLARDLVVRALSELSLERRAVLVMHDIEGHGMEDIATALGIPLGTGYSRLRQGRIDLTAAIRRLQAETEAR
jgi:RNA polymerase sigma-70 factor (ECF subfamily)